MQDAEKPSNNMDILQKIKTMPAMASMNEKELTELLRISKISSYEPGELIVDEGTYDGWIYYLISGRVRIVKNGTELAVLRRIGDIFGAIGAITGGDLAVSVYALDDATCLKIDMSHLDSLPNDNRYVFRYVIFRGVAEILAKRLRVTTEKYLKAKEEIKQLTSGRPQG
jgi:CRP/FNR family transcriptional regulator, cyclic AMP receptor protein